MIVLSKFCQIGVLKIGTYFDISKCLSALQTCALDFSAVSLYRQLFYITLLFGSISTTLTSKYITFHYGLDAIEVVFSKMSKIHAITLYVNNYVSTWTALQNKDLWMTHITNPYCSIYHHQSPLINPMIR